MFNRPHLLVIISFLSGGGKKKKKKEKYSPLYEYVIRDENVIIIRVSAVLDARHWSANALNEPEIILFWTNISAH